MRVENGEWRICGLTGEDIGVIRSADELVEWIRAVGFLPYFANEVKGFSVEEHTLSKSWWTGDPERDPWLWREAIARGGQVAYGKFFNKKAGFISPDWLPVFANYRRDGYDFESWYEDGKADHREKKIMDLFGKRDRIPTFECKTLAGFGREGEKNFNGIVTNLEMRLYLTGRDFARKRNKRGEEYGWFVQVLATPESSWGEELLCREDDTPPAECGEAIFARVRELYPKADDRAIRKLCGI